MSLYPSILMDPPISLLVLDSYMFDYVLVTLSETFDNYRNFGQYFKCAKLMEIWREREGNDLNGRARKDS